MRLSAGILGGLLLAACMVASAGAAPGGEKFAVTAVNHAGEEGPAAELEVAATWKGPGAAFHLRTGDEDAGR